LGGIESFEGSAVLSARVEALGVQHLLGAPTTMWFLVGASPTGPTLNGQPDVDDFKAGGMGWELCAPSEPGYCLACHCYVRSTRDTKKNLPW
jgi:hypothetical protein